MVTNAHTKNVRAERERDVKQAKNTELEPVAR